MNGYLLDTSIALHAGMAESLLSAAIRDALRRGPNYLSVIVYWEVTIKSMKGLLDVGEPRSWWEDSLEQLAAKPLVIKPEHITGMHDCPQSIRTLSTAR